MQPLRTNTPPTLQEAAGKGCRAASPHLRCPHLLHGVEGLECNGPSEHDEDPQEQQCQTLRISWELQPCL